MHSVHAAALMYKLGLRLLRWHMSAVGMTVQPHLKLADEDLSKTPNGDALPYDDVVGVDLPALQQQALLRTQLHTPVHTQL